MTAVSGLRIRQPPLDTRAEPAAPVVSRPDAPAPLRVAVGEDASVATAVAPAAPPPVAVPVQRPPPLLALTSVTALQRTAGNRAVVVALQRECGAAASDAGTAPSGSAAVPLSGTLAPPAAGASRPQGAAPDGSGAASAAGDRSGAPSAARDRGDAPRTALRASGSQSPAAADAPHPNGSTPDAAAAASAVAANRTSAQRSAASDLRAAPLGATSAAPGAAPAGREAATLRAGVPAPRDARAGTGGPPAGGGDALGAWQAKVHGAIAGVKPRRLSGAQGAAGTPVRQAGGAAAARRDQQKAGLADDAKKAIPPPKQSAELPAFPDDATRTAVARVDAKLGRVLSPHTLPALQTSPQQHLPTIPADVPPAPPASAAPPGRRPAHGDARDPKDAKADDRSRKPAADASTTAVAKVPAVGATVAGTVPDTSGGPDRVESKTDVAAVVARLLAEPERHAARIVDDARNVACNGKFATDWPEGGKDLVNGEKANVDQELRRVAAAVGVGEAALDQKIAVARDQLKTDGQAVEADVSDALAGARRNVADGNALLARGIAETRRAVDGQVEARAAAAKGNVDLPKIRADRDRLIGLIDARAGQGMVAYEAATKKLKAALQTEVDKQLRAYAEAAAADEKDLQACYVDAAKARAAYRPTKYWLDDRRAALRQFQSTALREVDAQTETFTSELNDAAAAAREEVRDWAARRIGHERSFFQRLLDLIADWLAQSQVQTAAWQKRRAADEAQQVDRDLQFLKDESQRLVGMSKEEQQREFMSLHADQQAILASFFKGQGKDLLGALAEGMITRLSIERRVPLLKAIDAEVMALGFDRWGLVAKLAIDESPGLNPTLRADRLHDAFKGGTDEAAVFAALEGLTPLGGKAVEYVYEDAWGENLRGRLKEELDDLLTWSKHDINRANALLAGQGADAIAVQLDQAMHGNWNGLDLGGTDQETIFAALRNKSPEEIDAIKKAYKARYGKDLQAEVRGELDEWFVRGSHDVDRADALFGSDTGLADAISMDQAMHGGTLGLGLGTDRKTLEGVYETNDRELEQEADAKGWDSATLARRKAERHKLLDDKYQGKYHVTLTSQFEDEMQGDELNLVAGMRELDANRVDAARIALEHDSVFYADDKVINAALQGGFTRAYADRRRDLNLSIDEEMAADWAEVQKLPQAEQPAARQRYYRKWPPEATLERRKQALKDARAGATVDAQANFPKLEAAYDSAYTGQSSSWATGGRYHGLRADVAMDTQLTQHDKAAKLIEQGGALSETQEVTYAIRGAGTDDQIVRDIFKGKNKKEMDQLGADWEKENAGEGTFKDFVLGDFSGREKQEMNESFEHGEAETPRQKADRAKRLYDFESGAWLQWGSQQELDVLKKRRDGLEAAAVEFDTQDRGRGLPGFDWEKHATLAGSADAANVLFDSAVTSHRKSVDVVADTATQVVGAIVTAIVVVAAIVADVMTAGAAAAATPAWAAFLSSMWGMIAVGTAGLALTMGTKQLLKGPAYGWEDVTTDLAVGVVDIVTMAATAGTAGKLLKGSKTLLALFENGKVGRILAKGAVQSVEGMIQAAPGAVFGNLLNPANFQRGDNAILNVLGASASQIGIAGVTAGFTGMLHASVQTDLVRIRTDPIYQAEIYEKFRAANPGKGREDFLQNLDRLIAGHTELGFDDPRLQEAMRTRLLEHVPSEQHRFFSEVTIEVLPDDQFQALTRSATGRAVTVVRNGEPVVILRGGASFDELAFEGPHLQQVRDPENAPRIALLDEARMQRWDSLSFDEQLEVYRAKIGLEIQAHEQILRSLDAAGAGAEVPTREKARTTLENLREQLAKVDAITPEARRAAIEDPLQRPAFLDQPARLFSKEPPAGARSGPRVPEALDQERSRVNELRRSIEGLERRAAERGRWTEADLKSVEAERARLRAFYGITDEAGLPAAEARLFDQRPNESLEAYRERLVGLEREVHAYAMPDDAEWNYALVERYEAVVREVGDDIDQVGRMEDALKGAERERTDVLQRLARNDRQRAVLAGGGRAAAEGPTHNEVFFERVRIEAELRANASHRAAIERELRGLRQRDSLLHRDEPWRRLPLRDAANQPITPHIGIVGEIETTGALIREGWDPLGDTADIDPRRIRKQGDLDAAIKARSGVQDIDGVFKASREGVEEYLVGDSKGTADSSPGEPRGTGALQQLVGGEYQLSDVWIERHLDQQGLSSRDRRNLRAGLAALGQEVRVSHPDGSVDVVRVRKLYAQTYRESSGALRTRLYEVGNLSPTQPVILGRFHP